MGKAYIEKDGTIWMSANMKKDHRIFGYKDKDIYSEKMILLSPIDQVYMLKKWFEFE